MIIDTIMSSVCELDGSVHPKKFWRKLVILYFVDGGLRAPVGPIARSASHIPFTTTLTTFEKVLETNATRESCDFATASNNCEDQETGKRKVSK